MIEIYIYRLQTDYTKVLIHRLQQLSKMGETHNEMSEISKQQDIKESEMKAIS